MRQLPSNSRRLCIVRLKLVHAPTALEQSATVHRGIESFFNVVAWDSDTKTTVRSPLAHDVLDRKLSLFVALGWRHQKCKQVGFCRSGMATVKMQMGRFSFLWPRSCWIENSVAQGWRHTPYHKVSFCRSGTTTPTLHDCPGNYLKVYA